MQYSQDFIYSSGSWGDLLVATGFDSYEYDEIGNLTFDGQMETDWWYGRKYEWDGRRLTHLYDGEGYDSEEYLYWEIFYTYNDQGIRTSKNVDGTLHTYYLDGSKIITEVVSSNDTEQYRLIYLYDAEGAPIGLQYRDPSMAESVFYTYWFEKNLQGDIIAVYNEAGTKLITYTYDAWGNVTQTVHNSTGTNIHAQKNPFRYRGYYYDTEIALYYLQSRYYNPRWGRFINADAISYLGAGDELLGFNLFAYCGNNPVMGYDPEGTWNWGKFWDGVVSIGATIAGVVAAAATGVGILKTTGSIVLATSGGMVIGATVTGVVNNTVNTIYYHNSEGISDLEQDPNESSYVTQGYIDRWSRLDYVKSQLGGEYSQNAWRYY